MCSVYTHRRFKHRRLVCRMCSLQIVFSVECILYRVLTECVLSIRIGASNTGVPATKRGRYSQAGAQSADGLGPDPPPSPPPHLPNLKFGGKHSDPCTPHPSPPSLSVSLFPRYPSAPSFPPLFPPYCFALSFLTPLPRSRPFPPSASSLSLPLPLSLSLSLCAPLSFSLCLQALPARA